jgi:GAF domain-containing protein
MDFRGRSYKSFVSVPVRAGNKSFGLLTADADRAYALTEVERGFLILIAGALGAGMAHVEAVEAKEQAHNIALPDEKGESEIGHS